MSVLIDSVDTTTKKLDADNLGSITTSNSSKLSVNSALVHLYQPESYVFSGRDGRSLLTLRVVEGKLHAEYEASDLTEAAKLFFDAVQLGAKK